MQSSQNGKKMPLNVRDKNRPVESDRICSFDLPDTSENSETITEEENCKQTEGKSSNALGSSGQNKTLSHTPGRNNVSRKQTNLKNEIKLLNATDSNALEKKWFKKWLNFLKTRENNTSPNQRGTKFHKEIGEITDVELDALRSFCTVMIKLMCKQRNKSKAKKLQRKSEVEKPGSDKLNLVVPVQQIHRFSLQDPKAYVRKMAGIKEHSSDRNKKRELRQAVLPIKKKANLESTRSEEIMEEYKYIKDILLLIGEIHKHLPKLSHDPEKIWKRLNKAGHSK
ncbi:uncharacterized protein C8orf48-like [Macrotis lagotis]|uniref:uncharacterized protein C8orf48-like n=1 Tax=Macrotis lagotis TaxID=92651 RepID=UPI003D6901B8